MSVGRERETDRRAGQGGSFPAHSEEGIGDWLAGRRRLVAADLEALLSRRSAELTPVSPGGAGLAARLQEFSGGGKMLRGVLVHLGAELLSASPPAGIRLAAAAMELFQSGLLVHDDIMDGDETRRGMPTLHRRYAMEMEGRGSRDPDRLGEALGICAGDVSYFEGFAALAEGLEGHPAAASVLGFCARELTLVGLGQMEDVRWGGLPDEVGEEAILRMYRGKTARYTFSMPLAVGALMAGEGEAARRAAARLIEIGELAGQVFQIRDDELGIFGTSEEIGKPVGSDIREGKKTIWRARLFARASGAERERLAGVFGNPAAGAAELAWVRELMAAHGLRSEIAELADRMTASARGLVEAEAGFREEARPLLLGLVNWAAGRRK